MLEQQPTEIRGASYGVGQVQRALFWKSAGSHGWWLKGLGEQHVRVLFHRPIALGPAALADAFSLGGW